MALRLKTVLGLTAAGGVLVAGVYGVLFFARAPTPESVLFRNPALISDLEFVVRDEPQNGEWRLRLAEAYLAESHVSTALQHLKRALATGADERRTRHLMRGAFLQLGRSEEALKESEALRGLDPQALAPRLAVAYCLLDLDRVEEARKTLRAIPLDDQGRPLLQAATLAERERLFRSIQGLRLRMQAEDLKALEADPAQQRESLLTAFVRVGDWTEALRLGRLAVQHSPERIGGRIATGQALLALGRHADAVTSFRPLRESPDFLYLTAVCLLARDEPGDRAAALADLEEALKRQPQLGRAWWELARLREARSEWLRAAECYANANALGVEAPRAARLSAEAFLKAGQRDMHERMLATYYQGSGQPEAGLRLAQRRLKSNPDDELAYRQVAGALGALERTAERIRILEQAHARFPESADVTVSLARTYTEQNMGDQALSMLRKAAEGPGNSSVPVLSTLASLCNSTGRLDEAEALYRRVIPLTRAVPGPRPVLAALLLRQRDEPEKLAEATRLLEESHRLEPGNAGITYELGMAYSHAGRTREAILALRHAIDLDPGEGLPYQPLGQLLTRDGQVEEGRQMLELAQRYQRYKKERERLRLLATRKPVRPEALLDLAGFYYRAKAYPQAGEQLERYLRLRPGDPAALERLAEVYGMLGRTLDQADILRKLGDPGARGRRT